MSESSGHKESRWGLLIFGMVWLMLSWGNRNDLMFPFAAHPVDAEISNWRVDEESWALNPGHPAEASRSGTAMVPSVEVRLLDGSGVNCTVRGARLVFGLRKFRSMQELRDALERITAGKKQVIFVREIDDGLDCRLSRAMSPGFMTLWSVFLLVTILLSVSMWRGRRRRSTDDQQETK